MMLSPVYDCKKIIVWPETVAQLLAQLTADPEIKGSDQDDAGTSISLQKNHSMVSECCTAGDLKIHCTNPATVGTGKNV
jgi:hypothetical protein